MKRRSSTCHEYKKQASLPAEKKAPPAIKGYDNIDKVKDHSWRDRVKILEYYNLPKYGESNIQIARLEGHLEKLGKKKSTSSKKRSKKSKSGKVSKAKAT